LIKVELEKEKKRTVSFQGFSPRLRWALDPLIKVELEKEKKRTESFQGFSPRLRWATKFLFENFESMIVSVYRRGKICSKLT
jgi:hypothetical protein